VTLLQAGRNGVAETEKKWNERRKQASPTNLPTGTTGKGLLFPPSPPEEEREKNRLFDRQKANLGLLRLSSSIKHMPVPINVIVIPQSSWVQCLD
jgi:hypothetical protein